MRSNSVVGATWKDFGYRRICPSRPTEIARCSSILNAAREFDYHIKEDSSGKWIRRKDRTIGFVHNPITYKSMTLNEDNFKTEITEIVDLYLTTNFSRYKAEASIESVRNLIYQDYETKPIWQLFYDIAKAIMFCPSEMLKILLIEDVFPIFFKHDNHGRIIVFLDNYEYYKMLSFLRAYYTNHIYPISGFPSNWGGGFLSLKKWQDAEPLGMFYRTLSFLDLITYPYILSFDAGKFGIRFLFLFSQELKEEISIFPIDWMHWAESKASFGEQDRKVSDLFTDPADFVHKRYQWTWRPSIDETETLVNWFWERSSRIFYELSDPCNFIQNGNIDGVWAYENLLTLDRLLRQTIRALSVCDVGMRKSLVFEIADLWGTIAKSFDKVRSETDFFKKLFNPTDAKNMFLPIIKSLPSPFNGKIKTALETIYAELSKTILDSVWVPGKRINDDVSVKDNTLSTDNIEDINSFTSNVIRALRNAHHGYLSRQDRGFRPSRYLSLVTGDVPDSLSYLPIIWWLCFLASPKDMVNFDHLQISHYDSV